VVGAGAIDGVAHQRYLWPAAIGVGSPCRAGHVLGSKHRRLTCGLIVDPSFVVVRAGNRAPTESGFGAGIGAAGADEDRRGQRRNGDDEGRASGPEIGA
jgi:hypothetical protein